MYAIVVLVQFVLFEHQAQFVPIRAPFRPHLVNTQGDVQLATGLSLAQPAKLGIDALVALQPIFISECHLRFQ